jgi:hypothetical protein
MSFTLYPRTLTGRITLPIISNANLSKHLPRGSMPASGKDIRLNVWISGNTEVCRRM